jgi:hypothetical protein
VDINQLLVPSQTPETSEESAELLNVFFEFLQSFTDRLDFWFDQFKNIYLIVFYPRAFKEMGVLAPDDSKLHIFSPPFAPI